MVIYTASIVSLLLEHGADPKLKNTIGETAVMATFDYKVCYLHNTEAMYNQLLIYITNHHYQLITNTVRVEIKF